MSNPVLIDVRTPEEYRSGHAEGAENLSLQDIEAGILPSYDRSTEIQLYCRSGGRSGKAQQLLQSHGFTNVSNLGGLSDVGL